MRRPSAARPFSVNPMLCHIDSTDTYRIRSPPPLCHCHSVRATLTQCIQPGRAAKTWIRNECSHRFIDTLPDSPYNCPETMASLGSFHPKCIPNSTYRCLSCTFYSQSIFPVRDTIAWPRSQSDMDYRTHFRRSNIDRLNCGWLIMILPAQNQPICNWNKFVSPKDSQTDEQR